MSTPYNQWLAQCQEHRHSPGGMACLGLLREQLARDQNALVSTQDQQQLLRLQGSARTLRKLIDDFTRPTTVKEN